MFTPTIGRALPKQHMAKVYNTLSRQDAVILVQLQTGHLVLTVTWHEYGGWIQQDA